MQLVAPFAPHIAEELWEQLGHTESVFDAGWPAFDEALAAEELIDDRRAGERQDARNDSAGARRRAGGGARGGDGRSGDREVRDGPPKKVIFVPGRLLNIVV